MIRVSHGDRQEKLPDGGWPPPAASRWRAKAD